MKRTVAIAVAAAIAGGVAAFSVASYASSGHPSSAPSPSSTASAAPTIPSNPSKASAKRQFLHGERVVKDKDGKIVTVDAQVGSVTAASSTALTVKSGDGTTWTWTLNGTTKVRGANLKVEPATSIKVGDTVAVIGQRSGATRTARAVADPPPNRAGIRAHLRKLRRHLRNMH